MNLLYISFLNGDSWAGPTYSVPKQIDAQSVFDNVFWYNIRDSKITEWKRNPLYHDLNDYPEGLIRSLPTPFCSPDLVIVEQFYGFSGQKILFELMSKKYNYIIIPRGELTQNAQIRKSIKKKIANILLFKSFAKKAVAIQYLTTQEKNDSGEHWNKNSFVISNGIDVSERKSVISNSGKLRLVFIGRISPYQKGLDMLIDACSYARDDILDSCLIDVYGPDYDNQRIDLEDRVKTLGLESIIRFHDGVFGKEKEDVLLASDVFLIPSRFEGHPMALIEALSYGLPCIATTGSNMRTEVERCGAGWCADNNAQSIADALRRMMKDREHISIYSENAVQLSQEYDWKNIAENTHMQYFELYKKTLVGGGKSRI